MVKSHSLFVLSSLIMVFDISNCELRNYPRMFTGMAAMRLKTTLPFVICGLARPMEQEGGDWCLVRIREKRDLICLF